MAKTPDNVTGFRARLFLIIVLAVGVVTTIGVVLGQRHLSNVYEEELENSIRQTVSAAAHTRQLRQAVLAGICADLAAQPRIHAALEDDALDLLYPSATHELSQIMREHSQEANGTDSFGIEAIFYRFIDLQGNVIRPEEASQHGRLHSQAEDQLQLEVIPHEQQIGYLRMEGSADSPKVAEVIAVPIISNETFQPIAVLAVGFPFDSRKDFPPEDNLTSGIRIGEALIMPTLDPETATTLERKILETQPDSAVPASSRIDLQGLPHRLLLRPLNPGSAYPLAQEVFLSSLLPLQARQTQAKQRILIAASIVLMAGLLAAGLASRRLARPVEALAVASEEEHQQRLSAEDALDSTSRELERAARFSADASHQLKTPVAVVRAGLEELLIDDALPDRLREEVRLMIAQTGRLTRVIEDLLLLSRLDAGRLEMPLSAENLRLIIDSLVDDFSTLPESHRIRMEVKADDPVWIRGNRSYTALILQTLLENAWKYNRPGGLIRIVAEEADGAVICRVGNTGKTIHPSRRVSIFERFHRGSSGENVPGYGLGLNLAVELVRLHGGSLDLISSEDDWTEFKLTFVAADHDNPNLDAPS